MSKKSEKVKKTENSGKNGRPTPLRITDTTLRDAHQSLWATRMRSSDIMEIIGVIDDCGYYSLEVWGGATFDVCLRFLRENPWERLRMIKERAKKTPLQMLLRGQNILGYRNYPDDLLDRFTALSVENGMDIFRIFDALNDTRNLRHAIEAVKRYGGHAQGTLSYTISPVHTVEKYVACAKEQVEMGIDSLCIKDMAGILSPVAGEELVRALVGAVKVPIQVHSHATSGMATAMYLEVVRAGAGAIDCAISPLSGQSSQPPVETMVEILRETPFATDLNMEALSKVRRYFEALAPKRAGVGRPMNPIDPEVLLHHIPGGMISNLRSQLEQQGALDRLDEVFEELPKVREDLGFPPLVTPTSQIIGIQAVMNVLSGERYSMVPQEVKDYVKGLYGRSPAPIKAAVRQKILGDEKPIKGRPADLLEPMLPTATDHVDAQLIRSEEDIISYCLFPAPALEYFKWRNTPVDEREPTPADIELKKMEQGLKPAQPEQPKPFLGQQDYKELHGLLDKVKELQLNELTIRRNDLSLSLKAEGIATKATRQAAPEDAAPAQEEPAAPAPEPKQEEAVKGVTIDAPLNGTFYASSAPGKPPFVKVGDTVKEGDPVCVVEAMKLFNEIKARTACKILNVLVKNGEAVKKDQPLMTVEAV